MTPAAVMRLDVNGCRARHPAAALEWMWARPTRLHEPMKKPSRVTPGTVEIAERGRRLVARRGAGLCLVEACTASRARIVYKRGGKFGGDTASRPGPPYCEKHNNSVRWRGDRELMRDVLDHAAAAFAPADWFEVLKRLKT